MVRSYESALRREQADKTRLALLEACEALLLEGPVEEVTLPKIAKRAGVTAPTAYRHFPTQDALMAGFMEHLRHRIGMGHEAITAVPPESVHAIPLVNYASYEKAAPLLRAIMQSPAYDRVRLGRRVDRAGIAAAAWGDRRGEIPDDRFREMLGALYLLVTPAAWRWLRETWGLDGEAAARAASWATGALAEAILAQGARGTATKGNGSATDGANARRRRGKKEAR